MDQLSPYQVWNPNEGKEGDGKEFTCLDHEYAAQDFASDQCDRDPEYYRSYEEGVDLHVRLKEPDQPAFKVHVWMEMTPEWHARMSNAPLKEKP